MLHLNGVHAERRQKRLPDPVYRPEKRRSLILACLLFWSVISYRVISQYVVQATEIVGPSMAPTLADGERFIIQRWLYLLRKPRRGEIVAVRAPFPDDLSVKRIIGLPGERVRVRHGRVYVNDRELGEPYLAPHIVTLPGLLTTNTYEVAPDCYFVLGDNREVSEDSRFFGAVPREQILGRIAAN